MSYRINIDPTLPKKEGVLSLAGQLHDLLTLMGGSQDGPDKATLLASLSQELDEQQNAKNAVSGTTADNT
jgi:hypothetical protein